MSRSNRKTTDFDGMKYSPELIRRLSDPEYARKAEEYERQAQGKASIGRSHQGQKPADIDDYLADYIEPSKGGRRSKRNSGGSGGNGNGKNRGPKKTGSKGSGKKHRWRPGKLIRNLLVLLLILIMIAVVIIFIMTGKFEKVDTDSSDFAINSQVAEDLKGFRFL